MTYYEDPLLGKGRDDFAMILYKYQNGISLTSAEQAQLILLLQTNGIIPNQTSSLFWLDGNRSGENFLDASNGLLFPITDRDWDDDFVGFPYKSTATTSAPDDNPALFAALGANSFWYGATYDAPNQIPVVSLFQNIDYEDTFFCRHVAQTVDSNGVELTEAYITDIVAYDAALTGSDLTTANSYYGVATEITSGVKWVAKDGNDGNLGTKESPWLTMQKALDSATNGDTIYVKSGVYTETSSNGGIAFISRNVTLKGIGRVELVASGVGAYSVYFYSSSGASTLEGVYCSSATKYVRFRRAFAHTIKRCYFDDELTSPYAIFSNEATGSYVIENSIILGAISAQTTLMEFNDCLLASYDTSKDYLFYLNTGKIQAINSKLISENHQVVRTYADNTEIDFKGCDVSGELITNGFIHTMNVEHGILRVIDANDLIALTTGTVTATINNNTIIDEATGESTACRILNVNGSHPSVEFNNNTMSTSRSVTITTANGVDSDIVNIYDNKIITTAADAYILISISSHSGSIYNNSLISGFYSQISSEAGDQTAVSISIYNNYLSGGRSCTLAAGSDDGTGNNYSECLIYNNYLYSPTVYANGHSIFIKDVKNVKVYHNYIKNQGLAIVIKGYDAVVFTGVIWANLIEDCSQGIVDKGASSVQYYNNTIKDCISTSMAVGVNDDTDDNWVADDVVFKNNIIDTTQGRGYVIGASINGFDCDYNTVYATNELALVDSVTKNWLEWQALLHDENGVNADPLLTNLIPATGSPAIGAGATLNAAYDDGLDVSTDWGDSANVPSVVTKQQTGAPDCGAYVR